MKAAAVKKQTIRTHRLSGMGSDCMVLARRYSVFNYLSRYFFALPLPLLTIRPFSCICRASR